MCTQRNVNMEFHVIIFIPSNAIDELMKHKQCSTHQWISIQPNGLDQLLYEERITIIYSKKRKYGRTYQVIIFISPYAIDELMKQKHNVPSINEPIMLLSSFRQTHLFIYYRETKTYAHLKEKWLTNSTTKEKVWSIKEMNLGGRMTKFTSWSMV